MRWFRPKKSNFQKLMEEIMGAKEQILQAIADEQAQVAAGVAALNAQIQALRDQLAAGTPITEADLEEIKNAVQNIFTPPTE